MKMLIDKAMILKQIESLANQLEEKKKEIRRLEEMLKASQMLLSTYRGEESDLSEQRQMTSTGKRLLSDSSGKGTSVDAIKLILESGPMSLTEITERLITLGHFVENRDPKSSVHVTLSRKQNLFEKVNEGSGIKWKLKGRRYKLDDYL